ncbi:tryptophan--tRNA ligase, partial [Brevibacillus sp. SIMBA_076]
LFGSSELDDILSAGAEKANQAANQMPHKVEKAMGMARL